MPLPLTPLTQFRRQFPNYEIVILERYLQTMAMCFLDGRSDRIQPRQRSL